MSWIKQLSHFEEVDYCTSLIYILQGERKDQFSAFIPNQFQINISSSMSHPHAIWRQRPFGHITSYTFPLLSAGILHLFPSHQVLCHSVILFTFLEGKRGIISMFRQSIKNHFGPWSLISLISMTFSFNPHQLFLPLANFLLCFPLGGAGPPMKWVTETFHQRSFPVFLFVHHFYFCSSNSRGNSVPLSLSFLFIISLLFFPLFFLVLFQVKCNGPQLKLLSHI